MPTTKADDMLFSTPTLNDALPALGTSPAGDGCYQMHEDDWRQFEFVDAAFGAEMASELADIDEMWKDQSVPLGDNATAFRRVHVRRRIPKPLDIRFSVVEFEKMLGGKASPMTLIGCSSVLRDVHAIRLENVVVYACIESGRLITLGVEPVERFAIPAETVGRIERFVTQHNLRLVHWRSRTLFATTQSAMKYLAGDE